MAHGILRPLIRHRRGHRRALSSSAKRAAPSVPSFSAPPPPRHSLSCDGVLKHKIRNYVRKDLGEKNPNLLKLFSFDPVSPIFQHIFLNNVQTEIVHSKLNSPGRIEELSKVYDRRLRRCTLVPWFRLTKKSILSSKGQCSA